MVSECLEAWFIVQRKWAYLEGIFIGIILSVTLHCFALSYVLYLGYIKSIGFISLSLLCITSHDVCKYITIFIFIRIVTL